MDLRTCDVCGALTSEDSEDTHADWHRRQDSPTPVPVTTETERDPGPCPSVSPSGRNACQLDEGHKVRHLHEAPGGPHVRWSDEEATRG
jgi:hypothetical protein